MLHYFAAYFLLLLLATGAIVGWYMVTRGRLETKPDGTIERKGMIFKGWYLFWMKKTGKKRYYYDDAHREKFMFHVEQFTKGLPGEGNQPFVMKNDIFADVFMSGKQMGGILVPSSIMQKREIIEETLDVKLELWPMLEESSLANNPMVAMAVYKEEDTYQFPEWVRKMVAGCITCHASIYGTIIFVAFHLMVSSEALHQLYKFAEVGMGYWVAVFCTWIWYTFFLSFTLTLFNKQV